MDEQEVRPPVVRELDAIKQVGRQLGPPQEIAQMLVSPKGYSARVRRSAICTFEGHVVRR